MMDRVRHKSSHSTRRTREGHRRTLNKTSGHHIDKEYDSDGNEIQDEEGGGYELDLGQVDNVGGEDADQRNRQKWDKKDPSKVKRKEYLAKKRQNHEHAALRVARAKSELVPPGEVLAKNQYSIVDGSMTYKTRKHGKPVTVPLEGVKYRERGSTNPNDKRPVFTKDMIYASSRRTNKDRTLFQIDESDYSPDGYCNLPKWDSSTLNSSASEYIVQWNGDNNRRVIQALKQI